jgi:SET domain/MYND finger
MTTDTPFSQPSPEERQQAVQECISWLTRDFPQQHQPPTMVEFRGSNDNFGVYATRAIAPGEILWTIPNAASLCERLPELSFLLPLLDSAMVRWSIHIQKRIRGLVEPGEYRMGLLLCVLFYQHETGALEKSNSVAEQIMQAVTRWSPFFQTWPVSLKGNPLYWSSGDLKLLVGTSYHARAIQLQKEVQELWERAIWPALKEFPLFVDTDGSLETQMRPLFYKALTLVRSRAYGTEMEFQTEDWQILRMGGVIDPNRVQFAKPILYPLIDIINGAPKDKSVNVALSGFDKFLGGVNKVTATREIQVGEEIIIDYGDSINNVDYFEKFGFIPVNPKDQQPNIHPTDVVTLEIPPALIPSENDCLRWQQFERRGLTKERLLSNNSSSPLFSLRGDPQLLRQYRHQPPGETKTMNPQIHKLMLFAYVMCMNDNALRDIPQEEEEEPCWAYGKVVVEIIDHSLSKLPIVSATNWSENQRTAAHARTLTREVLLQWRHAVCVQELLYPYRQEAKLPSLPDASYCQTCSTTLHLKKCSLCHAVSYCSQQCQRDHWPAHKKLCPKGIDVSKDEPVKIQL